MWKVFRVSGAFPCWTWISPESWLSKIPIGFKRWESFSIIAHHEVLVQWFSRKGWPTPPFAPKMSQFGSIYIYITTQDAIVTTRHETFFLGNRESPSYIYLHFATIAWGEFISKIPTTKNTSFLVCFFAFSSTWNNYNSRGWQLRSPNSETFLQFLSSEDWLTFGGLKFGPKKQ